MSLTVSADLVRQANDGTVSTDDFVQCVRTSLPYAYDVVAGLVDRYRSGAASFIDNQIAPPDETARGQLLRAMSSNAIRESLETHFGVTLAFQNCHRVAVFGPNAQDTAEYRNFTSLNSQILNQRPEFVNC